MKTLLEGDQDLLEARDADGSTALHCACWKGHLEAVRFLVQAGANLQAHNTNDHWGTTPLCAAEHANRAEIATLLIEAGADVNARDMNGQTPLHYTGFHKASSAAKVLVQHGGIRVLKYIKRDTSKPSSTRISHLRLEVWDGVRVDGVRSGRLDSALGNKARQSGFSYPERRRDWPIDAAATRFKDAPDDQATANANAPNCARRSCLNSWDSLNRSVLLPAATTLAGR